MLLNLTENDFFFFLYEKRSVA